MKQSSINQNDNVAATATLGRLLDGIDNVSGARGFADALNVDAYLFVNRRNVDPRAHDLDDRCADDDRRRARFNADFSFDNLDNLLGRYGGDSNGGVGYLLNSVLSRHGSDKDWQ